MKNQSEYITNGFENYITSINLRNKKINYIKSDVTISNSLSNESYWELWMLDYIIKYYKPNSNIVDAGAHIGTTTLLMSEVLTSGNTIYSFEPIFNDILLKNIKDNNLTNDVIIYPYGLGSSIDNIQIPAINLNDSINFGGTSIVGHGSCNNNSETIDIPIYNLDIFKLENVSIIKIDVENMEIELLEGAIDLITACKPTILIETFDYDKLTNSNVFSKMSQMGYNISPIAEGWNDYLMKID